MNGDGGLIFWNARAARVKSVLRRQGAMPPAFYEPTSVEPTYKAGSTFYLPFYPLSIDAAIAGSVGGFAGGAVAADPEMASTVWATSSMGGSDTPRVQRCILAAASRAGGVSLHDGAVAGTKLSQFVWLDGRHCATEYVFAIYRAATQQFDWFQFGYINGPVPKGVSCYSPTDALAPGLEVVSTTHTIKVVLGATVANGVPSVAGAVAAWIAPVHQITPESEAFYFQDVPLRAGARYASEAWRNALYYDWARPTLPEGMGIARIGVMDENGDVSVVSQCLVPSDTRAIALGIVADNEHPTSLKAAATFYSCGDSIGGSSEYYSSGGYIRTGEWQWNVRPAGWKDYESHTHVDAGLAGVHAVTLSMPYQRPSVDACVHGRQQPQASPSYYTGYLSASVYPVYAGRGLLRDDLCYLIARPLDLAEVWPVNGRYGWVSAPATLLPARESNVRGFTRQEHAEWAYSLYPDTPRNFSIASLSTKAPPIGPDERPIVPSLRLERPRLLLPPGSTLEQGKEAVPDAPADVQSSVAGIHAQFVSGRDQPHSHLFPTVSHGQPIIVKGKKITGLKVRFRPLWSKDRLLNLGVRTYETSLTPPPTYLSGNEPVIRPVAGANIHTFNKHYVERVLVWTGEQIPSPQPKPPTDTRVLQRFYAYDLNYDVDIAIADIHKGYLTAEQERLHVCLEHFRLPWLWREAPDMTGRIGTPPPGGITKARADLLYDRSALLAPAPVTGEYELRQFSIGGVQSAPGFFCYRGEGKWQGNHKWTTRVLCKRTDGPTAWRNAQPDPTLSPQWVEDWGTASASWVHVPFDFDCRLRAAHVEMYAAMMFTSQEAGLRPAKPGPTASEPTVPSQEQRLWNWNDLRSTRGRMPKERKALGGFLFADSGRSNETLAASYTGASNEPRVALIVRGWIRSVMKGSLGIKITLPSDLGSEWDFGQEHSWQSDIENRVTGTQWPQNATYDRPDNSPTPISEPDLRGFNSNQQMFTHKGFCLKFSADQLDELLAGQTVVYTKWLDKGAGSAEPQTLVMSEGLDSGLYGSSAYGVYTNRMPQWQYPGGRLRTNIHSGSVGSLDGHTPLFWQYLYRQGDDSGRPSGAMANIFAHREYEVAVSLIME